MVMLHYKLNGISKYSNMVANILPSPTHLTLGIGSIGKNSTFSEHGPVAYQIKGNHECTYIVATILLADHLTPLPPPCR